MLDLIKRRRSIRKFTAQDVGEEQVQALLEAAFAAPTAHNRRPLQFIVVRRLDLREMLAETHEYAGACRSAPVVIVVCAEPSKSPHCLADACVAAENILLAAVGLGLGAVWVAAYPYDEHQVFVRGVLEIPDELAVICLLPVGHPVERKPPRTGYDPARVHRDLYGLGAHES